MSQTGKLPSVTQSSSEANGPHDRQSENTVPAACGKPAVPSKPRKPHEIVEPQQHSNPQRAKTYTGSTRESFPEILLGQVCNALWVGQITEEAQHTQSRAAVAALGGIAPRDEVEGMLAAQMVACHAAAMECYRRAMISGQSHEGRQQNLNYAARLSRTYALHMEALDKHRGKGQQTVRVEHVTVNAGGQAIVGHVETKPGGGSPEKPAE